MCAFCHMHVENLLKGLVFPIFLAYFSTVLWWHHWFLFKILVITVLFVSTELCIVSEIITPHLKAIVEFFQNIKKIMVSLPFIFCWCKHIFLMVFQIFTEKHFSCNFQTTDPLNMVDPSFFSFLRDLHTDDSLVANKYTKNIK